jgi:hypothetical protein
MKARWVFIASCSTCHEFGSALQGCLAERLPTQEPWTSFIVFLDREKSKNEVILQACGGFNVDALFVFPASITKVYLIEKLPAPSMRHI